MQNPINTGPKLLPATPEGQIAAIRAHEGLYPLDRDILIQMIEIRESNKTIVANNTSIKALNAESLNDAVTSLEAPFGLNDLQTPRHTFFKLAYRALFWISNLPREVAQGWQRETVQEFDQELNLEHARYERFLDACDRLLFTAGHEKFSPTAKQMWNELADITGRETFPRYSAQEIANTAFRPNL